MFPRDVTTPGRTRRPGQPGRAANLTVGTVLAALLAPGPAALADEPGTLLLEDDFMHSSVTAAYVTGGRGFAPCLTAGEDATADPVPGCALPAGQRDPEGAGALRLTEASANQAGFLLYDRALPTKAGLDITFHQYQWGGTGADGISFFLTDGEHTLDAAGAYGASLGYHFSADTDGVAHALLGVGFDVHGNFPRLSNDPACGPAHIPGSPVPHSVTVRGPGHERSRYCLLGPVAAGPELDTPSPTRPAPVATRVVIDPPATPSLQVRVYLDGRLVTSVDQPDALRTAPTFKFGWAASTGGLNDVHEINFLAVQSVEPILPDLALSGAASPAPAESSAPVTLTVTADAASGPVPAHEPITITAAAPDAATVVGATGSGWDCSATTDVDVSCTHVSHAPLPPGSQLPPVTVTLERTISAPSGLSTLTATVTSASDDPVLDADNTAEVVVRWNPVAQPVDAGTVDASATPGPSPGPRRSSAPSRSSGRSRA